MKNKRMAIPDIIAAVYDENDEIVPQYFNTIDEALTTWCFNNASSFHDRENEECPLVGKFLNIPNWYDGHLLLTVNTEYLTLSIKGKAIEKPNFFKIWRTIFELKANSLNCAETNGLEHLRHRME
jgi:hypothetical protein